MKAPTDGAGPARLTEKEKEREREGGKEDV
jgi:hypothetical protein